MGTNMGFEMIFSCPEMTILWRNQFPPSPISHTEKRAKRKYWNFFLREHTREKKHENISDRTKHTGTFHARHYLNSFHITVWTWSFLLGIAIFTEKKTLKNYFFENIANNFFKFSKIFFKFLKFSFKFFKHFFRFLKRFFLRFLSFV